MPFEHGNLARLCAKMIGYRERDGGRQGVLAKANPRQVKWAVEVRFGQAGKPVSVWSATACA